MTNAVVCRPSAGLCDVPESCSGSSAYCPTDIFKGTSSICSTAPGLCSIDISCPGNSPSCPTRTFDNNGQSCSDNNPCTIGDTCSQGKCIGTAKDCTAGNGGYCQQDTTKPDAGNCTCADSAYPYPVCHPVCGNGILETGEDCEPPGVECCDAQCHLVVKDTVCRSKTDACDVPETCDGVLSTCPANAFAASGVQCRAQNMSQVCDVAEFCTGNSAACPIGISPPPFFFGGLQYPFNHQNSALLNTSRHINFYHTYSPPNSYSSLS
jgi:hypothetical protein